MRFTRTLSGEDGWIEIPSFARSVMRLSCLPETHKWKSGKRAVFRIGSLCESVLVRLIPTFRELARRQHRKVCTNQARFRLECRAWEVWARALGCKQSGQRRSRGCTHDAQEIRRGANRLLIQPPWPQSQASNPLEH